MVRWRGAENPVAVVVAYQQILGRHTAFAHASGCRQNAIFVKAGRDVAIVRGDPATLVHHPPGADDFFAKLLLAGNHVPFDSSKPNKVRGRGLRLPVGRYNDEVETRRMCPNCRAFITSADKVCPYCEIKLGPPAIARRAPADILGGLIPHARFTTTMILLINAGIYLAEELPGLLSGGASAGLPLFQAAPNTDPIFRPGSGGGC